jgi:hypothetical protein
MKLKLFNKFLIIGILLYLIAGIASIISKMNYSILILLASAIFLALGVFVNVKLRWFKLFKKKT